MGSVPSMCSINGSKRNGTMHSHKGLLEHAAQSAGLRRKADRLHLLRSTIDKHSSRQARQKHALLSTQIFDLHEAARQLENRYDTR